MSKHIHLNLKELLDLNIYKRNVTYPTVHYEEEEPLYPSNPNHRDTKNDTHKIIQVLLTTSSPQIIRQGPRAHKFPPRPLSPPLSNTRIPTRLRPPPPILRPRSHRHIQPTNRNRTQPRRLNPILKIQIPRLRPPIPSLRHLIPILPPIQQIPLHSTNHQIIARDTAPLRAIQGADAGKFGNRFVGTGEDWGRDFAGAFGVTFGF